MTPYASFFARWLLGAVLVLAPTSAIAQQESTTEATANEVPVIADQPLTVDPASLMPPTLAKHVTHDFSKMSLREVIQWLRQEHQLAVLVDEGALIENNILLAEPVSERLQDEPLYLLLDRLRGSLDLDWYLEDNIIRISTPNKVLEQVTTVAYNVSDLVDAGYEADGLAAVIERIIAPVSWDISGGAGSISEIGDVMFVLQTDRVQREIQGFLTAIRNHGRRTFTYDPPQHIALREKLQQPVSVNFDEAPLEDAVAELSDMTHADIRLDRRALRDANVREREPITLALSESKLSTVLQAMTSNIDLAVQLRDGVLWITSRDFAMQETKAAIYDVRDLCRDHDESEALAKALRTQTHPTEWHEAGGLSTLEFSRPGTMVISAPEYIHGDVLRLLEAYRSALRDSKPRQAQGSDPDELITVYYRLHTNVALDLKAWLPTLVRPETWKSESQPNAPGSIIAIASAPDVLVNGVLTTERVVGLTEDQERSISVSARSVLIIQQTREVHDEIKDVIRRVETGDPLCLQGGMGASGLGGFGSGLLSQP